MAVKKETIKKFSIEYATTKKQHSNLFWAEQYGVSTNCIKKWLKQPEVIAIIEKETVTFIDLVRNKARKNVDIAMRELKKIVKSEKLTDVKRKACNDMLGIAKIENINQEGKIKVDVTKNYTKMTNKDLEKAYDELLGNHSRKKKNTPDVEATADDTIN